MPLMPFDPSMSRLRAMIENMQQTNAMGYGMDMPENGGFLGSGYSNQPIQTPITPEAINSGAEQRFPQEPLPSVVPASRIGAGEEEPEYDPTADYLKIYQPERSAKDRLESIMASMPERNKPGFMRKLSASLLGFGGQMRAADQALYDPYYNQIEDWKLQLDPALKMADDERMGNNNMRMMANQIVNQKQSDARLERLYRRDATIERQGDARLSLSGERVQQGWERLGQTREGLALKQQLAEGGQVVVDSRTGQSYLVNKKGEVSELPIDQLSFEEKEIIKANQRVRAAKESPSRASTQRDRLQLKVNADGSYEVINLDQGVGKGVIDPTTKEPVKAGVPRSELEEGRGVNNKAKEVAASNPQWSKWIKFTKSGQFERITPPSMFGGGWTTPTKEEFDKIYKAIYGAGPSNTNQAKTPGNQPNIPKTTPAPGLPPIEKRTKGMEFTFPNGNVGRWDGTKWVPVKVVTR